MQLNDDEGEIGEILKQHPRHGRIVLQRRMNLGFANT